MESRNNKRDGNDDLGRVHLAIDTHVHLDAAAFAGDLAAVVARAAAAGVTQLISIGADMPSSAKAVACSKCFPGVWASVGVHPHEAEHCPDSLEADLTALAENRRVVAIGETGLDFYRNLAPAAAQYSAFERQIVLARRLGLPLVIHSRQADDAVFAALAEADAQQVVLHCFTGDRAFAQRCLDRGWYLAFGGAATYPRNDELRAVIATVPAEQLLFETDAPYLAPVPHRGRRNEPAWLTATIACCAEVRHTAPEALAEQAVRNAVTAFPRLSPPPGEEN
ncbi:MAG TPA: TatD family hydrolase [Chloroflexota bacterium]|jgi:TatD DNase family protein|nr:TatD family hydrolase [Chloroflexota bacterium]